MTYDLTGTIVDVFPIQTFAKGFRKREYVVETGDQRPQKILFTLVQDKCDYLDSYGVGDTVTSSFEVKGREWQDNKSGTTKYFNSLEVTSMSGQQRSDTKKKAAVSADDEDDEIFRSLGIDIGPKKASTSHVQTSKEQDDDLPW